MATTTNYGWTTPDDTNLVKDGASAIRTLGSSVDTTVKNLNPETTLGDISYRSSTANTNTRLAIGTSGQVLTVSGGVPAWATPSDQTPLTTKGDLFTYTTTDARLGVGTNGQYLSADSTEATGLKWVNAPTAGANWSIVNSGGTSLSGAATVTVSGISGADKLMVLILASTGASGSEIRIRFNADSGNNYYSFGAQLEGTASYSVDQFKINNGAADSGILLARNATAAVYCAGYVLLTGGDSSGIKSYSNVGAASLVTGTSRDYFTGGYYNSSSTISSVSAISSAGDFDDGTIYVYKSA